MQFNLQIISQSPTKIHFQTLNFDVGKRTFSDAIRVRLSLDDLWFH